MSSEKNNRLHYNKKISNCSKQHWVRMCGLVKMDRLTSLCVAELIKLAKAGFNWCDEGTALPDTRIIRKAHYEGRYYLACAVAHRRMYKEKIPYGRFDIYNETWKQDWDNEFSKRAYGTSGEWSTFILTHKGKKQKYIRTPPSRNTELYMKKILPSS